MNYFKRALYSLKKKKIKNILLILTFSVLFVATLSVYLVYVASSEKVNHAQKTIANAVTLVGPTVRDENSLSSLSYGIPKGIAVEFVNSDYVEGYSLEGVPGVMQTIDCEAVVSDETAKIMSVVPNYTEVVKKSCSSVAVSNSEYNTYFVAKGFNIVKGEKITSQDNSEKVALVSDRFAEKNNLDVGDTFSINFPDDYFAVFAVDSLEKLTLTVKGIYAYPQISDSIYNDSIANMIFIPIGTSEKNQEQLLVPNAGYLYVTAYLNSTEYLDDFIAEVKEKINIGLVSEQISRSNSGATVFNQRLFVDQSVINSGDYEYQLVLDRSWYEMVAKPMEKVSNLTAIMTIGIIIGTAIMLALITVLNFKGRKTEFGILLAIGEKPVKIFGQLLLETFIPVIIALIVGLFAAQPISSVLSQSLISQNTRETAESNEQLSALYGSENEMTIALSDLMTRSSYGVSATTKINVSLNMRSATIYVIWIVNIVLATVFLQMFLLLRRSPARIIMDRGK